LVELGADLKMWDGDGLTALHQVTSQGNVNMARVLVELGADIHAYSAAEGLSPMHFAAMNGQVSP
jgi:ankyrin repeat protein